MTKLVNRAKMTTATTGTGTITLGTAEAGYQSFADAGVVDGDVVRYVIEDGTAFEIGTGTFTASGTTLTRTVSESSNADAALNLTGSAVVYVSATAADIPPALELYAENPSSPVSNTVTGDNAAAVGSSNTSSNVNSLAAGFGNSVSGSNAVAVGRECVSSGIGSAAVGFRAFASASRAFAAATDNNSGTYGALSSNSVAIGRLSKAFGTDAVSIGDNTSTNGTGSVAIGPGATAINANRTMALGHSRASGTDSFAAAIANNTSTFGATGANSVAIGKQARASNTDAVAIGNTATASGISAFAHGRSSIANSSDAVAIGIGATATATRAFSFGDNCIASASYAFAMGRTSKASFNYGYAFGFNTEATRKGVMVYGGGTFSARGDAQCGTMVLRTATTDATPVVLTSDGSAPAGINEVQLPNNSAYAFHGTIVARQQASQGTACAAFKIEGLIRREGTAASTVLVNSATTVLDNTPGFGMTLSADTVNGGLKIEVTGLAATNIRFVATISTSEVTF